MKIRSNLFLPFIKLKFDREYYLKTYPDVKNAGVDPWWHYKRHGYWEGRKTREKHFMWFSGYKKYNIKNTIINFLNSFGVKTDAKIAVILHLFYMDAWGEIKSYINGLKPYDIDLYISYVDEFKNDNVLADVKKSFPQAVLFEYPNQGFDIGSFVDILNKINLDNYDVVYKLHSKGIHRKKIFIYDQIFKKRDWFENLWNGLFGYKKTDEIIKLLTSDNKIGIVAAENLIVKDPPHKQHFTHKANKKIGIPILDDYHYVAGTCFAIRSKLLKPIQSLNYTINNFETVKRGVFSTAHVMERLICACIETQGYYLHGIYTRRNEHRREVVKALKTSSIRLLFDNRIKIDYDFFYKCLEGHKVERYDIINIKLGDIKRRWWDKKIYNLNECSPYKYLHGNIESYKSYCKENIQKCQFDMSEDRFNRLIKSMDAGFDSKFMPIIDKYNIIMDGQHRCCILLYKYGPNYEVRALKLF